MLVICENTSITVYYTLGLGEMKHTLHKIK